MSFQKIYGLHGLNHQIIEYLVSRGRYWLVLGVAGSEQGGTGCQHDELSENIWVAWPRSSNYWIFEIGKSDYGQTDRQTDTHTDRISSCRLDPFCRKGRLKIVTMVILSLISMAHLWGVLRLLVRFLASGSNELRPPEHQHHDDVLILIELSRWG